MQREVGRTCAICGKTIAEMADWFVFKWGYACNRDEIVGEIEACASCLGQLLGDKKTEQVHRAAQDAHLEDDDDWVTDFIETCCDVGSGDGRGLALYEAYREYCETNLVHLTSMSGLKTLLERRGFRQVRKSDGVYWLGLCARPVRLINVERQIGAVLDFAAPQEQWGWCSAAEMCEILNLHRSGDSRVVGRALARLRRIDPDRVIIKNPGNRVSYWLPIKTHKTKEELTVCRKTTTKTSARQH